MISASKSRIPIPLSLPLLLILLAAYLLPGLIDHDPWKGWPDDAVSFGISFEMLQGNWLVPTLAGEPVSEASPLFFWVAALLAKIFSPVLPLHGGARLASGLCTGVAVLCIALAAGELFGAAAAGSAALVLIGCLGLLFYAHAMTAQIALLAALAAVFLGLALAPRRPLAAGAIAGCGIGAAFLSYGVAPAATALLLVALVTLARADARKHAAGFWLALGAASAPWLACWPIALYFNAPHFLADWWSAANLAQLPGPRDDAMQPLLQAGAYLKLLAWYGWPALPLAVWCLWRNRTRLTQPGIGIALLGFVLLLAMLSWGTHTGPITALPLLLPLTLLAAAAAGELRRGAANALDWFGMMTFTLIGALVWAAYIALQTDSLVDLSRRISLLAQLIEPGFVARVHPLAAAAALAFTAVWIVLIARGAKSPYRGVTNWAAGVTLFWGLAVALLLPTIDYGKTYRGMAESLKPHLTAGENNCVASRNLGEAQRASLHYFIGLITLREEVAASECAQLLVQDSVSDDGANPGPGWQLDWTGNRPGDLVERFRLYRRLN